MLDKIQEFIDQLQNAHTQAAYENDLTQFVTYMSEHTSPPSSWQAVSEEHVRGFMHYLLKREYASSSIARKMAVIKRFFAYLVEKGYLHHNPAENVETPRAQSPTPRVLSREEVERLLQAPANDHSPKGLRDRALLEIMYATGLRASEVVSLTVDDVDLVRSKLRCRTGPDKVRSVSLPARALHALHDYLERGRPRLVHNPDNSYLFVNLRGKPLTRQGLWLIIREYVKRANIPAPVSPHTLRHTFVAHHLRESAEFSDVQQVEHPQ